MLFRSSLTNTHMVGLVHLRLGLQQQPHSLRVSIPTSSVQRGGAVLPTGRSEAPQPCHGRQLSRLECEHPALEASRWHGKRDLSTRRYYAHIKRSVLRATNPKRSGHGLRRAVSSQRQDRRNPPDHTVQRAAAGRHTAMSGAAIGTRPRQLDSIGSSADPISDNRR